MPLTSNDTSPVQTAVANAVALERAVAVQVQAIKAAQADIDATWEKVKDAMIANGVKSFKGDFGSITIAERTTFKVEDIDILDDKYKKLAPDTRKIGNYFALTGDAPEGAEPVITQYLTKRLK